MKKEQRSVEFYLNLAENALDPDYRQAFRELANMELRHKTEIEDLFVNIGYPEKF
jgi:rubrerythrin